MQYETISVWWDGEGDMLWVNLADGEGDMVRTKDGKSTVKVDERGNILGFYIFGVSKRAMQSPISIELVPETESERQSPTAVAARPISVAAGEAARAPSPTSLRARLNELRHMKDGWLESQGSAPPQSGLDWLIGCFERHYPAGARLPHLYPTFEGGVQAEWSFPDREINLEMNLQTHQADWYNLDLESDDDEIKNLNLDDANVWDWIANEVSKIAGGFNE